MWDEKRAKGENLRHLCLKEKSTKNQKKRLGKYFLK